ncbi:hypothetical protein J437_LFUL015904 [Ladona fulva]|uniref:Uncharacterized protein n=1 Tax=Ladona fulva TaxID=123851 RepID=A0A8K0KKY9_LADFU|nr:hypothetical protein J437_LFUL015904 [Ladona fulva]
MRKIFSSTDERPKEKLRTFERDLAAVKGSNLAPKQGGGIPAPAARRSWHIPANHTEGHSLCRPRLQDVNMQGLLRPGHGVALPPGHGAPEDGTEPPSANQRHHCPLPERFDGRTPGYECGGSSIPVVQGQTGYEVTPETLWTELGME